MWTAVTASTASVRQQERKVIFASSLGTVFEWYDFYLYGALAPFFAALFFSGGQRRRPRSSSRFAASRPASLVRPFGALVFGRLGDLVGRKYTFLVTIMIMGAVDLRGRPAADVRVDRDRSRRCCWSRLRLLQGLALGGEYGGAATYVAEHAPDGRRGSTPAGSRPRRRSASSCRCS